MMEKVAEDSIPSGDDLATPDDPKCTTSHQNVALPAAVATAPQSLLYDRLKTFQDASLQFFSTASNETLGACAIGLCASTYLVLGRVGLVLIGAVGGVVLHATWEAQLHEGGPKAQDGAVRRRELGIEVVRRVLDWRDLRHETATETEQKGESSEHSGPSKVVDYKDFQPETREALIGFTDAAIRDYVKWWYSPILPSDQTFPAECRLTLTKFIVSFSNQLSRKRTADPFLDFLANSTSILIVFLNELSVALKASQRQDAEEAIRAYLQYQPDSNLANVLSIEQQERKLNLVADDILQNFLEPAAYQYPPAKAFLRQVLSKLILESTVLMCSRPEWINEWIVYLLETGDSGLMNVIDAGVEDMNEAIGDSKSNPSYDIQPESKHRRQVSRAEEAMQEAMREAQRLNEMIAEDDARRKRTVESSEEGDTASSVVTETGIATPTSSDSGRMRQGDQSLESSTLFEDDTTSTPAIVPSSSKEPSSFTSFDQLEGTPLAAAIHPSVTPPPPPPPPLPVEMMIPVPLTLQHATITILDMSDTNPRSILRQKPAEMYFVQIEPASSRFPGWMVSRKYSEFESLHEILRRIAPISGVPQFTQHYTLLPSWKGITQDKLIQNLEAYLKLALQFEPLAESEAMKKFLEKETGLEKIPAQSKNVLVQGSAALENVGKNFINVLGQGGKGIAGGGKAVFGGVQGVFGAVATGVSGVTGQKKPPNSAKSSRPTSRAASIMSPSSSRINQDLPRFSTDTFESEKAPPLPERPNARSMDSERASLSSLREEGTGFQSQESLNLPPPPSEISDEYTPVAVQPPQSPPKVDSTSSPARPSTPPPVSLVQEDESPLVMKSAVSASKTRKRDNAPITEEETRVLIELMFAIITELYSLSSAWTIRLSLLSAAKAFLLRPNNPQLESIRVLLQETVLDANFSDTGIAAHINKLRENTLPTEEERAAWPAELSANEKEKLRIKARKLLVERGMPQALTSVMGAAASGEALGRVFDCLQMEEVSRGLMFAMLLQAIRAVTQ